MKKLWEKILLVLPHVWSVLLVVSITLTFILAIVGSLKLICWLLGVF